MQRRTGHEGGHAADLQPGLSRRRQPDGLIEANTIIRLADTPGDWAAEYPAFLTRRSGPAKSLSFSDYAVVVQAALLGQGIALGWLTVAAHWLPTGALVPASETLSTTRRLCELVHPHDRSIRPVVSEIRDWIIEQMQQRHGRHRPALPALCG